MSEPKYHTVLWDMDGVIIDSERHWQSLEKFFLRDVVGDWNSFDQARLTGRSLKDIYEILANEHEISIEYREYLNRYNDVALTIYQEQAELMPNAKPALAALNDAGIPQGLVSSSTHTWIDFAMERFQIGHYFHIIVSSDDVDGRGKPDPAIYEYACQQLDSTPEETMVIEDSIPGIQAAHSAGCNVIWYNPGHEKSSPNNPDHIINNLNEVPLIVI